MFVDGGVTLSNNPAFLTFLMATTQAYWRTRTSSTPGRHLAGPDRRRPLLLVRSAPAAANANEGLLPAR